jgi:hypothetical protein
VEDDRKATTLWKLSAQFFESVALLEHQLDDPAVDYFVLRFRLRLVDCSDLNLQKPWDLRGDLFVGCVQNFADVLSVVASAVSWSLQELRAIAGSQMTAE